MKPLQSLILSTFAALTIASCGNTTKMVGSPENPTVNKKSYVQNQQATESKSQRESIDYTLHSDLDSRKSSSRKKTRQPLFKGPSSTSGPKFLHYKLIKGEQHIYFTDDWAVDMKAYVKAGSNIYRLPETSGGINGKYFMITPDVVSNYALLLFFAIDRDGNASRYVPAYSMGGGATEREQSRNSFNRSHGLPPKFSRFSYTRQQAYVHYTDADATSMKAYVQIGNDIMNLSYVRGDSKEKNYHIPNSLIQNNSELKLFAVDQDGNKSPNKIVRCSNGRIIE